jgi:hypothetical protein
MPSMPDRKGPESVRLLPLSEIRDEDRLATSIWGADRRLILSKGSPLTAAYRALLTERGYWALPVEFPGYEGVEAVPWLSDNLVLDLVAYLLNLPERFDAKAWFAAQSLVTQILEEYWAHPRGAVELFLPRDAASNPAVLAINRALVVIAAGHGLFDEARLPEIVLAALLLDSGPGNALATGVIHDSDDPAFIQEAVGAAVAYLQQTSAVSFRTLGAIRQAYTHWDGSGTPPLRGPAIYEGAQLLAPANKLARLLMPTPEHPPVAPHEALEWVIGGADLDYALRWVATIKERVAPYATGTTVRLSTGELAVVTRAPLGTPTRPHVRFLTGPERGTERDLQDPALRNVVIVDVYWQRELESA